MAETTGISWADHTWNPWIGCTAVSPACDHCYAEAWAKRWGRDFSERRRTSAANWRIPAKLNAAAAAAGVRRRVFPSLMDPFDNQVDQAIGADFWRVIAETPWLDWLLLTKRPQNIRKMLPAGWGKGWPNVWLGTTAENQDEADRRLWALTKVPAVLHFVSCEPLLGPVWLPDYLGWELKWVICGGESGPGARPMDPAWARSLRDQCAGKAVPFHFKQWGGASAKAGGRLLDGREHLDIPLPEMIRP
ncbi:phage Gp37/Gp68 family protein [Pararoseomonas sp. SCSIO 73927]|uniref:DUF5131 family protein n=1 Tax=Pararoseomonas sp. SCSIO 73927 TaxID=3114537 RepID=UPI0030CB3C3F